MTPTTISEDEDQHEDAHFALAHELRRWCRCALGSRATIPAMMISEMPLPIPRSVICSPIHITNIVPAVTVSTVIMR